MIGGIPTTGGTFQFTARVFYTFTGDLGQPVQQIATKLYQIVVVAPQPPVPGLTLSPSGVLSGTPTRAGTFNFTITVTDGLGRQASTIYAVTIRQKLAIVTTSLPGGTFGALYAAMLGANGGTPPYAWSLTAGALPAGITLSATGTLSGTPTVTGTFPITVQAVDRPQADSATQNLTLSISSAVSITTDTLPNASPGLAYAATLTTSGGIAPFTWSIVKGALPAGILLNLATGTLTGVPTGLGSSTFTAQVIDASNVRAAKPFTIVSAAPLAITTLTIPAGTVGASFSQTLSATGGIPPYTWSVVNGQLPPGLTLDSSSGVLAGTPTQSGTFVFVAQVRDNAGAIAPRNLLLNIAAVNSNTLLSVFPMALEFNAAVTGDNPPAQSVSILSPNDAAQNFAVITDGGTAGTPAGKWITVRPLGVPHPLG